MYTPYPFNLGVYIARLVIAVSTIEIFWHASRPHIFFQSCPLKTTGPGMWHHAWKWFSWLWAGRTNWLQNWTVLVVTVGMYMRGTNMAVIRSFWHRLHMMLSLWCVIPGPPICYRTTLKNWEWPEDETALNGIVRKTSNKRSRNVSKPFYDLKRIL